MAAVDPQASTPAVDFTSMPAAVLTTMPATDLTTMSAAALATSQGIGRMFCLSPLTLPLARQHPLWPPEPWNSSGQSFWLPFCFLPSPKTPSTHNLFSCLSPYPLHLPDSCNFSHGGPSGCQTLKGRLYHGQWPSLTPHQLTYLFLMPRFYPSCHTPVFMLYYPTHVTCPPPA